MKFCTSENHQTVINIDVRGTFYALKIASINVLRRGLDGRLFRECIDYFLSFYMACSLLLLDAFIFLRDVSSVFRFFLLAGRPAFHFFRDVSSIFDTFVKRLRLTKTFLRDVSSLFNFFWGDTGAGPRTFFGMSRLFCYVLWFARPVL